VDPTPAIASAATSSLPPGWSPTRSVTRLARPSGCWADTSAEGLVTVAEHLCVHRPSWRLGRLLRPKGDGRQALFYSVVARGTLDTDYAVHRQRFLAEQGYAYRIVGADDQLGPASPKLFPHLSAFPTQRDM